MRFASELQPIDNHTFIFVSFPGIKMKIPSAGAHQKKSARNIVLCVQVDEHERLREFSFVREASMLQMGFTARQHGRAVIQRVLKLKHSLADETNLEYKITDTLSIVQRETDNAFEYVLIEKAAEKGEAGRRKPKRRKHEKVKVIEHVLFIVMKSAERADLQANDKVIDNYKARVKFRKKPTNRYGFYTAEEHIHEGIMRMQMMRPFERDAKLVPALLLFLGPGDQLFPLPRAEPCA